MWVSNGLIAFKIYLYFISIFTHLLIMLSDVQLALLYPFVFFFTALSLYLLLNPQDDGDDDPPDRGTLIPSYYQAS